MHNAQDLVDSAQGTVLPSFKVADINALQDSTVVMLRSQEDGGWTDRLLVTLSTASGPATRDRGHDWRSAWEWDSWTSPVVDVEYGEETL